MYAGTLLFLVIAYILFQFLAFFPLLQRLFTRGYNRSEIESDPNLLFDSAALGLDRNLLLVLELGMFAFAFAGFFIGLRFMHQKTLQSVLTGYDKFRTSRFVFAFITWSALLVVFLGIQYVLNPGEFTFSAEPAGLLISALIMLVLMPIQTGLEEVVFRGYLIQGLAQVLRNGVVPLIITSLVFGLAHMSNPEVRRFGWEIMLPYYVLFALFMGAVTLLDEGLELAIGIHFANNMVSSILISSPNSVIKTYSLFSVKTEDPKSEMLGWLLMAGISFSLFAWKYKWKNFKLIIK